MHAARQRDRLMVNGCLHACRRERECGGLHASALHFVLRFIINSVGFLPVVCFVYVCMYLAGLGFHEGVIFRSFACVSTGDLLLTVLLVFFIV